MIRDYSKWFVKRRQWWWWVVLAVGAVNIVVSDEPWWSLVVLAWAFVASLSAFVTSEAREIADSWRDLFYQEREANEQYEEMFNKLKNAALNYQNRENS